MLLFVWVGALQILFDKGKDLDWFNSPVIVVLAVVTAIAFAAWLIWELTEQHPIVDLSLFKSRSFTSAPLPCAWLRRVFRNVVLMPLWLQGFLGYTATWAGLVSAPSGVTAVLTSLMMGRLMRRYDPRRLAAGSFALYATSYFMRSHLTADSTFLVYMLPQLVQGFAMGLFFISMLSVIFDGLAPQKVPAASGLSNFLRITVGSFATSADHDALGPARIAASGAVVRNHQRVCPRLSTIAGAAASTGAERSVRGRGDDPGHDRPKLPAVIARPFLSLRLAVRRPDSPVLPGAPSHGRRGRCGGGRLARPNPRISRGTKSDAPMRQHPIGAGSRKSLAACLYSTHQGASPWQSRKNRRPASREATPSHC